MKKAREEKKKFQCTKNIAEIIILVSDRHLKM